MSTFHGKVVRWGIVMSTSGGLFADLLSQGGIFQDRDVLRPTYTPSELPHREEQIKSLASILVPALRGETPSNVLIYGKTGTGKTAVTKYVGKELEETGFGVKCAQRIPAGVLLLLTHLLLSFYKPCGFILKRCNEIDSTAAGFVLLLSCYH